MIKSPFIALIENLNSIAKEGNWKIVYDKFSDALYWSKATISLDSKLKKFSRETSLYVTSNGTIEGLMIQYFKNNFLTQNNSLAQTSFAKSINDTESGEPIALGPRKEEVEALFSESIKNDILKDALEANFTLNDLDEVLRV